MQRRIRYFEMQCERHPRSRHFLALADLQRRTGEPARAAEILEQGLAHCGDSVSARYLLGEVRLALGETATAAGEFRRVLEADPGHTRATEGLARCADTEFAVPVPEIKEAPAVAHEPEPEPEAPGDGSVDPGPREPDASASETALTKPAVDEETAGMPEPVFASPPDPDPVPAPETVAAAPPAVAKPATEAADTRQAEPVPSTFVTRTLSDIYLSQGHRDKALRILYQILAAHPEREDIVARISELEGGAAPPGAASPDADPEPAPPVDPSGENRHRFDAWVEKTRKGG